MVSQRLSRLAAPTGELLELAAVAGTDFELEIVRRAAALEDGALLEALEEGVRSGMIAEVPAPRLAFRFTHELVRRALYDRLGGLRRANLHLRVGEAIVAVHGGAPDRFLADLAHHFARAAPVGGIERAVEYNVRAARASTAALAHEDAAARFRTALELGIADRRERAEVQLELGAAEFRAGQSLDCRQGVTEPQPIWRESSHDRELFARAAVGYEDACWRPAYVDLGAIELLEEAVEALGEDETPLRVMVLSGLARALERVGYHERGALVQANAVAMARRLVTTAAGWPRC